MSAAAHLDTYADGWSRGNAEAILLATSEDYTFDDPNCGLIRRQGFAAYLTGLMDAVKGLRGGTLPKPFMELSEVVTHEDRGVLTAWCWWRIDGTNMQGSGLIKVGAEGVRSEVVTYYTRLPE